MWVPAVVSLLFAHFRPYKNDYFNIINSIGFAILALSAFLIMYAVETKHIPVQLLYLLLLIPFLYYISFILYKIFSRVALFRSCCRKIGEKLKAKKENQPLHFQRGENNDEDLQDRIENPDMYQSLLPPTNGGEGNSQSEHRANSLVAYGSV